MLNYVAINITDYLADGPWKDPSPTNIVARTPKVFPSAELPVWGNIPSGFILALIAAVIVWWLLYRVRELQLQHGRMHKVLRNLSTDGFDNPACPPMPCLTSSA